MEAPRRAALIAVALAAIALGPSVRAPGADTDGSISPPSTFVVYKTHDSAFLAWTPVAGAVSYAVYRGPDARNLTLVAHTTAPTYADAGPETVRATYAVAAVRWDGQASPPAVAPKAGRECVAMSSDQQVSVNVWSCLRLIP